MELKKLINISTCTRGQRLHFWSELLAKSSNYLNQYSDKKYVADLNHIQSDTHIYPISELGQGTVDYWTHLMLKTNTSYFTGSSQLNKRFFFIFVTPSEIYIHMAAYRQFLSFDFISITLNQQTVCITPLYDSEAASGILKTYWRSIFRWDFGNKLCINFIYPSSSLCLQSK